MNGCGKSDGPVIPAKPTNKVAVATAEPVEERGSTKGNTASKTRPGHRAGQDARSALDRVRQVAVRDKEARFTALLHHVDVDRLRDAYRAINPNAAPGVDEVTWAAYGQDLEDNLRGLHQRLHAGRYRARPTRRVYIPKTDGRLRPLGIAALEDKILQRAVARGAQRDLRGGLPWLLLRMSSWAWPARRVGRVDGRSGAQEGELGARRGHPRLFRPT